MALPAVPPLPRQYNMMRRGLNGTATVQHPMDDFQTNLGYYADGPLPFSIIFSRGGFVTTNHQTRPTEKSVYAVLFCAAKVCRHEPGITEAALMTLMNLPAQYYRPIGTLIHLDWNITHSLLLQSRPGFAERIFTLKMEQCNLLNVAEAGQPPDYIPEDIDSPPPRSVHGGRPVIHSVGPGGVGLACDDVHLRSLLVQLIN